MCIRDRDKIEETFFFYPIKGVLNVLSQAIYESLQNNIEKYNMKSYVISFLFSFCLCIVGCEARPVSYTHLDVYKRQLRLLPRR